MIYHITTTPECNLCCEYCCGKSFSEPESKLVFEPVPTTPTYTQKDLASFLKKDKNKPVSIIFYGGEPLMNIEFIKKTIDEQKKFGIIDNFLLQTNGVLLNKLPKKYVNSFHTILVSIDGGKNTTNKNRGKNTWEQVTNNLKLIKKNGFKGEIIARMTIEEPTNFFEEIMELIEPSALGFKFDSIHWQLDANMWHDYHKRNFSKWVKQYNQDITKLIDYWINKMPTRFIKLYPFVGITNSLLFNNKFFLRCGSGIENFSILTNGKISACPIMSGIKKYYLGDIKNTNPQTLPFKLTIKEPCTKCDYYELCGGRCLYSNLNPVWPEKGITNICDSIKHLIDELEKNTPRIKKLLEEKKISEKEFDFLKYNCCEIIP